MTILIITWLAGHLDDYSELEIYLFIYIFIYNYIYIFCWSIHCILSGCMLFWQSTLLPVSNYMQQHFYGMWP